MYTFFSGVSAYNLLQLWSLITQYFRLTAFYIQKCEDLVLSGNCTKFIVSRNFVFCGLLVPCNIRQKFYGNQVVRNKIVIITSTIVIW